MKPLPAGIAGTTGRYLRGIAQQGDRLMLIVDVTELLAVEIEPTDASAPDSVAPGAPGDGAST